jgi:hypothetical protein
MMRLELVDQDRAGPGLRRWPRAHEGPALGRLGCDILEELAGGTDTPARCDRDAALARAVTALLTSTRDGGLRFASSSNFSLRGASKIPTGGGPTSLSLSANSYW